jgi:hypothetical protein
MKPEDALADRLDEARRTMTPGPGFDSGPGRLYYVLLEAAAALRAVSQPAIDPATAEALKRAIMPACGKVLSGPDVALIEALLPPSTRI